MKSVISGAANVVIMFTVALLLALPVGYFGPAAEAALFPVVSEFRATEVSSTDSTTTYEISFDKVRLCEPKPDFFGWYLKNGEFLTPVNVITHGGQPKPEGISIFRPLGRAKDIFWIVANKGKGPFESQQVVLFHQCHFLWLSETVVNIPNEQ